MNEPTTNPRFGRCPHCGCQWLVRPSPEKVNADFMTLCDLMGTTPRAVRSKDASQPMVLQRQIIQAALREVCPGASTPAIGRVTRRDHATVLYSCRVVRRMLVADLVSRFHQVRG